MSGISNQKRRELTAEVISVYHPPEKEGMSDPRILAMPNIPKPAHGALAPRLVMRPSEWNRLRRAVCRTAGYHCEVCGADVSGKYQADTHEAYDIDYTTGEIKLNRLVCLCKDCHSAIHSGRMWTLYRKRSPLYPKEKILRIAEKCFKLVTDWDKEHDTETHFYITWADFLAEEGIAEEMQALFDKYNIKFYDIVGRDFDGRKGGCKWKDWHLVFRGQTYYTPYEDKDAWQEAMEKINKKQRDKECKRSEADDGLEKLNNLLDVIKADAKKD